MFNFFRAAEKVGSDLIQEAISEFDSIAARIQAGVDHNHGFIAENKSQIDALTAENAKLLTDATSGANVVAKLRALIS
jgi:hypothetical protein